MAATKISLAEIKKMLKSDNLIIGTERTLKSLKIGKVERVILSSNCPPDVESDMNHYAGISGVEISKIDYPNEELGIMCKKPFSISVLALLKGVSK